MNYKYRTMVSKGDLMKKVFTPEEDGKIDSATPNYTWKEKPPIDHVMSYCEPHTYGKVLNIYEEAKKRGVKLFHAPKIWFKEFDGLDYIFEILEREANYHPENYEMRTAIDHLKELIEYNNLRKIEDS